MTELEEYDPIRGWIFYDRDCSTCRGLALRLDDLFVRRGFRFAPLQDRWVQRRLELTREKALEEMRVLTSDGQAFGGADAMIFLAKQIRWIAPLTALARLDFVRAILDRGYRWIAAHRSCAASASKPSPIAWRTRYIALAVLPVVALLTNPFLPPWGFMWVMALGLFLGCKWLTMGRAARQRGSVCPFRATLYLVAWPGMDAARFFASQAAPRVSTSLLLRNAATAVARVTAGMLLLFVVARRAPLPLLAGWIGMIGIGLILHFGIFDLVSTGWRALRIDAPPIMDAPLRSKSLGEFWGRRWNGAFNDLALRLVFRPIARHAGIVVATFGAFFVSGIIHESVISLPANAGYGLPTAYFVLQAAGVLMQRRGWLRGRLFTLAIVAAPAFWLFHPPFVRRVILPFMQAIGAL